MTKTRAILLTGLISTLSIAHVLPGATPIQEEVVELPQAISVHPEALKARIRVIPVAEAVVRDPERQPVSHPTYEHSSEQTEQISFQVSTSTELLPVVDQEDIQPADRVLLNAVLQWLPSLCRDQLDHLVVRYDPKAARGQATSRSLLLRGTLPEQELIAVLIHECGHVMDLGALKGTANAGASAYPDGGVVTYKNDPSVRFYTISWKDSKEHRAETRHEDFVSGYAEADPFEDFAETLLLYALHNTEFQKLAQGNDTLARKYAFMRDEIFGPAFSPAPQQTVLHFGSKRVWDITKLAHGLTL